MARENKRMTVKELKEKLEQFNDNLIVMIPNRDWKEPCQKCDIPAGKVVQGVNEFDGCVFIEDDMGDE